MNKTEYWFLDAAIELRIPFNWLSASNLGEILNRDTHNLSDLELLNVLQRMFGHGDLFLGYTDRQDNDYQSHFPSRNEIASALYLTHDEWMAQPQQVYYGVTAQGGARWEALSNPQWERFFQVGYGYDPCEGDILASDRRLAEQLLAFAVYDFSVEAVVPESTRWSVLQPWQATYWKQLPIGYRVDFTYLRRNVEEESAYTPPDWVTAWYQRSYKWYTSYLEPD